MGEGDAPLPFVLNGRFFIKRKKQKVVLTKDYISWEPEASNDYCTKVPIHHVVAMKPCDCSSDKSLQCHFCRNRHVFLLQEILPLQAQFIRLFYIRPQGMYRWKLKSVLLRPLMPLNLHEWVVCFHKQLQALKRPKRCLVFVNPFGGKQKASQIYKKDIAPLFQIANIKTDVVITQRANHARDILLEADLSLFDGIIGVGGDGMFSELLNGLIVRTQLDAGLNYHSHQTNLVSPRLPIGIIPAGSTDSLSCCVTGTNDPITSALLMITGETINIDVSSLHQDNKLLRYNSSFLGYGYFGDLMAESENYRWMGPNRYNWAGLKKLLGHRLYTGHLKMLKKNMPSTAWNERCLSNCTTCLNASKEKTTFTDMGNSQEQFEWVSIQGQFLAVNIATMSCRCGISRDGISPSSHLGDGLADVILVKDCSRWNFLRFLFTVSSNNKSANDLSFVEVHRVKEFNFTALENAGKSVWNCDGEIVSQPNLNTRVHCQLVKVFGGGIEERAITSSCCRCSV